jgi:Flp pilus assembly protein TadG
MPRPAHKPHRQVINAIQRRLNRLWLSDRASVAPTFALIAIPLICTAGAAIDFSHASDMRAAMQGALDSASLQLVEQMSYEGHASENPKTLFDALLAKPSIKNIAVDASYSSSNGTDTVSLSAFGDLKTDFVKLIGTSTIHLKTRSVAIAVNDYSGCVLALNANAKSAVSVSGTASVSLNRCSAYSNSNNTTALDIGGSASLIAKSIGAVGGISTGGSVTTTGKIRTGLNPLKDPYADATIPAFSGCDATHLSVKSTMTISPGVYCQGISVNAGATLTLNPGIYYIDRGSFTANGGATVYGNGVTLIFTSSTGNNWATASFNGNATVQLSAPTSGPTDGMVMFGDRNMPAGTAFKFNGGATQNLDGAIYVPKGSISYSGGDGASTSCTKIIGDTVDFTGNSSVTINCGRYDVKEFGVPVVRLAA